MTPTPGTTRGRTARALTAVLAVFGVMMAMLMVSAPMARAHDGSNNDHGQNRITICHFVHGNGSTGDGYNIITISEHGWYHGHSDGDDDATKNWTHDDRDVVYNGTSCPNPPEPTVYTAEGTATMEHGPMCVRGVDYPDGVSVTATETRTSVVSQEKAQENADRAAEHEVAELYRDAMKPYRHHVDGACPITQPYTAEYPDAWIETICRADQTVNVNEPVLGWGQSTESYELALAAAQQDAADQIGDLKSEYSPYTSGSCTPGVTTFRQSTSTGGTADLCLVDRTTTVTVTYTGTGTGESGISNADALYIANQNAMTAAAADLARQTPTGATTGACGAATVAPVQPGTVAPVLPATVAPVQPATVEIPAAAAPLPATVPAGDGSSTPQVPLYGWALMVLAATALAASTVRLARGGSR